MNDRGSGSILAVAVLGAVIALSSLLLPLAAGLEAKARVSGAADNSALAAADVMAGLASGVPCDVAGAIATADGGELSGCVVDGEEVTVTVETTVFGIRVAVSARAGPRAG